MSVEPKHFLLVSIPQYGHALPLLQFGEKLSQFHRITFAVASSFLGEIQQEYHHTAQQMAKFPINFIGINEGKENAVSGEPDRVFMETNVDGSAILRKLLGKIYPGVCELFSSITSTKQEKENARPRKDGFSVDLVVVDNFLGGPAAILHKRGIPYYLFNTARVWLTQAFLTLDMEVPMRDLKFMTRSTSPKIVEPIFENLKDVLMENCKTVALADGIIFNSVREAEEDALADVLQAYPVLAKRNIYFTYDLDNQVAENNYHSQVATFLDRQPVSSVVYISFGSIAIPAAEQVFEIGQALLQLKVPFIWSLPATQHNHLPIELDAVSQQFLVLPWAPQKQILAHPAISVFVSHCGWNSTFESLAFGVPVVSWPMFGDQLLNSEWLEREGVGRLIRGTGTCPDRLIPAAEVADHIRQVAPPCAGGMTDSSYRLAARSWQKKIRSAVAPGGSADQDFMNFVIL